MSGRRRARAAWAASVAAHGALAWPLQDVSQLALPKAATRAFEVQMLAVPPPQPEASPEPPPQVAPPPLTPVVNAAPRVTRQPVPSPPAPPKSAGPDAVESIAFTPPVAVSGLPARPGGSASSGAPGGVATASASQRPWAKLGDLSRKPRAPSLDALLRQNYPRELRQRGVEGQAEVRAVVNAAGRVDQVSVLSETAPGFALACKNTLLGSQWSQPLDRNGEPIGTRLTYRCRFQTER